MAWYVATGMGTLMMGVIAWRIQTGFNRLVTKLDEVARTLADTRLDVVRLETRLDDHIKNTKGH